MQLGYFQVIAEPVSTWVQEILEWRPRQSPRLVTKLKMPPRPSASPGYQFCTVEYLISASSSAMSSTTAACSWFSARRRAAFEIAHIGALVGDDEGALELAAVALVDAEIGRQLHRAAHARRHIDERAVGKHRRVQ